MTYSFGRRSFLASSIAAGTGAAAARAVQRPAAERGEADCPRCFGIGRVLRKDAKPFVWIEGGPPFQPELAVGQQHCPVCRASADPAQLIAEAEQAMAGALAKHRRWEELTGWELVLTLTRNVAIHTQLSTAQARAIGTTIESLMLHLQRVTESLLITPTRAEKFELVILWEQPAWLKFREVMEGMHSRQELGEAWGNAKNYNSYDHFVTPHLVESSITLRTRPPSCGPVFLAARRQINLATRWKAPLWLAEGFAAYGDFTQHKVNRWFTVYDSSNAPAAGDWMQEARRMARETKLRAWSKLMPRELRDLTPADYPQSMAMAAFLLESAPPKFLELVQRLRKGEEQTVALEGAYETTIEDFEKRCQRWLLARR